MKPAARFAYVQARLQARHGQRPDESAWRRLQNVGDLANYVQIAQQTGLRPWVLGLKSVRDSHEIELSLRRRFREYVDGVSGWLPAPWPAAVRWVRRLPDLPAVQHLLTGEAAPGWMLHDPELLLFAHENLASRVDAMQNSDCACLVDAWSRGQGLQDAWLDHWKRLWPGKPRNQNGLEYLVRLLREHGAALRGEAGHSSARHRAVLEAGLGAAFRRYSFQPAALYAHLGLTALDLERLRGGLVRRALFPETEGLRS
jgi:hypothetical protein